MAMGDADRDQIDEAPSIVATPQQILGWAETARTGDRFIYATRWSLPPGSVGAGFARTLAARGLINLCQRTIKGSRLRNYEAQRTSTPWPKAQDRKPVIHAKAQEIDQEVEQMAIDVVLPVLARAAQFRRPCPTDAQIGERCGIARDQVPAYLKALGGLNLIRVHGAPAPTLRQVTIVQTGFQTGYMA